MILQFILSIILGFFGLRIASHIRDYVRRRSILGRQINGPKDIFLLGNAHMLESDPVKFHKQILEYSNEFFNDKMFLFWIGTQAYVACHHPESVEKILGSNVVINKSNNYRFLHPWIGEGLLTSSGDKWKSKRKLLTPAFHFKILNDFIPIFNKNAKIMTNIVAASKLNTAVDVFPLYTMAALDAIAETAMGVSIDAQQKSDSDYVKAILDLSEDIMNRSKNPLLQNDVLFSLTSMGRRNAQCLRTVHEYSTRVIRERKHYREAMKKKEARDEELEEEMTPGNKKRKLAFLDLLLEYQEQRQSETSGEQITDLDIREEVDTFMFEGHDTTAAASTWATYLLAKYTDEQEKVHEELDAIFGDDKERDITSDDIHKMTYLDQVIKEALRIYPSVPYIGRRVEKDFDLCGSHIPEGTNIIVLTYALHYRKDIYPEPLIFKPERFSSENRSQERNPFTYVPFSAGPRNCIGAKFASMEEKILLASIFRKFNVRTEIAEEDLAPSSQLILRPSNPVFVKFSLR